MQLLFSLVHSTEAPVSSEVKKMSQSSKIGFSKYKAFLDAYSKANPELTGPTQIENAQELWKNVKNDPEKQSQMMLEFRTKAANTTSKLLSYWGKVATANPEPAPKVKPVNLVEVSKPIPAQIPEEPSTSSKGK